MADGNGKCPFPFYDGNYSGAYNKCMGSDCAWWDSEEGCCSVVATLRVLRQPTTEVGDKA